MLGKILAPHPTIYKYDRSWIGILLGLLVPFAGILVIYLLSVGSHYLDPGKPDIISLHTLLLSVRDMTLLSRFMSVGAMLNLGVFFLFINRDYYNVARGIIFSTMLIAVPVIAVIMAGWFR